MPYSTTVAFDWDESNRAHCAKHGLTTAEVEAVFTGPEPPRVAPDARHSATETRLIAVGMTAGERPIFVAFTWRMREGQPLIRPISARQMHDKEWRRYAEASPGTSDR